MGNSDQPARPDGKDVTADEQDDKTDTPPTDSGHSDDESQTQRNAEDESPS